MVMVTGIMMLLGVLGKIKILTVVMADAAGGGGGSVDGDGGNDW